MRHCHQILTLHLSGLDPAMQRVQGSIMATHIREVAVDMQRDQEEKSQVRKRCVINIFPNLLRKNLTYILRLCQVADHKSLPSVWKVLAYAPKRQQLTTLQRVFNDTAQRMSVHAPIVDTPGSLKISLSIGFRLEHRDNLVMGIPQYCLGKHDSSARKVLKACVGQHQVIAGGGSTPTLVDSAYLTAPYGVSFPETV